MRAGRSRDHATGSFAGGERSREGSGRGERATRPPVEWLQFNMLFHRPVVGLTMASSGLWNFETPPGFRGLDLRGELVRYSRNLPHWRQQGVTYWVTFRQADSLPRARLDQLRSWRDRELDRIEALGGDDTRPNSGLSAAAALEALAEETMKQVEIWLDQGMGSCVFNDPECRGLMEKALMRDQGERHELSAWVIMPNHVHLLIRPLQGEQLERWLQEVKRSSSRMINTYLQRSGKLWSRESHDRIVRDGEHLWRCLRYLGRNPLRAGLNQNQFSLWYHPEWEACGWGSQTAAARS